MLPLYSVQQGVVHSGYFNEAADKIGAYPNLAIPPETPEDKSFFRDVTGICDDPDLQEKWSDIVTPVNTENDLDGVIFMYRLAPKNTFCLMKHWGDPDMPDKNFGMDAGASVNNKFWQSVTEELFIHNAYSIFGPFGQPDKEWFCGHIPVWSKNPKDTLDVGGTEVAGAWGFVMNYLNWRELKDRSNIYERFAGCNLEFNLTPAPAP